MRGLAARGNSHGDASLPEKFRREGLDRNERRKEGSQEIIGEKLWGKTFSSDVEVRRQKDVEIRRGRIEARSSSKGTRVQKSEIGRTLTKKGEKKELSRK